MKPSLSSPSHDRANNGKYGFVLSLGGGILAKLVLGGRLGLGGCFSHLTDKKISKTQVHKNSKMQRILVTLPSPLFDGKDWSKPIFVSPSVD